jgi:hypothetical protein
MAIIKSIPSQRLVFGKVIESSEISIVSEKEYLTQGENCIIVKGVLECELTLNSKTTDHVKVKSISPILVKPDVGKIDEEWDEISLDKGACVEFKFCAHNWYILSSDGIKLY